MSWVIWSTMMIIPIKSYNSPDKIIIEINRWSEKTIGNSILAHEGNVKEMYGSKGDCIVFGGAFNGLCGSQLEDLAHWLRKNKIAYCADFVWIDENNLYDGMQENME